MTRWHSIRNRLRETGSAGSIEGSFEPVFSSTGLVVEGSSVASLLFGSVSPNITDSDVLELCRLILAQYEPQATCELDSFVAFEPVDASTPPWEQGYQLAVEALENLVDATFDHRIDLASTLDGLGVGIERVSLTDRQLRAVSFASPSHRPTIALNVSSTYGELATSMRFTLAHELCHLLHDRDMGASLAVANGPWAPVDLEKRANAFAAMLLMPPPLIRRLAVTNRLSLDDGGDTRNLADQLTVSHTALIHHMANVGLIDLATRDQLRPDLEGGA